MREILVGLAMKEVKCFLVALMVLSTTVSAQIGQILHEGCICIDSASVNQSLNWYALIKSEKKFYYVLKPVRITISSGNIACELTNWKITTDAGSQSLYLIGTKQKWSEREIYAPYNWDHYSGVDITKTEFDIYSIDLNDEKKSTSSRLYRVGLNRFDGFAIVGQTSSGQKVAQEIRKDFDIELIRKNGFFLKWFGDLDGDKKPDMILWATSNGEPGSFVYLYLSSDAGTNEVLRMAAESNIGYCG